MIWPQSEPTWQPGRRALPIPKRGEWQGRGAVCAYSEAVQKIMSKSSVPFVVGGAALMAATSALALPALAQAQPNRYQVGAVVPAGTSLNLNVGTVPKGQFAFGLKKSLFNFMHGICLDDPLQNWFEMKIPRTKIPPDYIEKALQEDAHGARKPTAKVVWLGKKPQVQTLVKSKKGNTWR